MTVRRPLTTLVLCLGLAAGFAACGGDDDKGDDTKVTTETTSGGEKTDGTTVTLKAALSGADEVPPGANPGVGAALVELSATQACADLKVTMGEKPTAAHIHKGAKGANGSVVVDLKPEFTAGESAFTSPKKCVDVPAETRAALVANPTAYYLNIHSDAHPNGAVRGQLDKF